MDLFIPRYHIDKRKPCGFRKLIVRQLNDKTAITEQHFPKETGHTLGLFGWDLISADAKEVIVCSDDFDSMIIYQALKKPVISLPKGISVLPVESLPMMEQFEKIVLWLNGGGNRAWQSTKIFARKLIESRCFLVSPEIVQSCPLTVFNTGGNLSSVIQKAQPVTHKSIVTFGSFRQEVYNELHNIEESCGVKWERFPLLTRILKGHRKGEMTVFTGPTGAGKTTFLSEYSLDLCSQGLRTLWGSFEIKNARLAKTMLNQFSRISLQKNVGEFDMWADRFELLPLYFLVFYGQQSMENVIEAMKHAVYLHDIEHIVVDNLQFMMGSSNFRSLNDRIVHQDRLIEGFRRFASEHDCHVTVVVHPRKELEEAQLTAQSIYGGVKASQEADNVLILQNNRGKTGMLQGRRYIEVVKNRFDGELGVMPLYFDKESQSFVKKEKSNPHWPTRKHEQNPAAAESADQTIESLSAVGKT
ncbi:twinkle mtDNA helicase-like [Paramacrobiotus metropolitanus]|uniref:twinkle mtDNA helicase-like n=1 Tax=Paramacrobiotus metropolitanus TaxID=2943436 RepID=UPI00244632E4|nr:twinkle mtDNA helicase-like [Paramacrobiotus metropolitanus]